MRMGILGLPGSGRRTVFEAMKGQNEAARRGGHLLCSIKVPDARIDKLSAMYNPKKTIYAVVEYVLDAEPAPRDSGAEGAVKSLRDCDALIMVVRNHSTDAPADPAGDYAKLSSEMVFADFSVLDKRRERIEADAKRGKKGNEEEIQALAAAIALLEKDTPLRVAPEIAASPHLRSFGLVSGKPLLVLFNNADDDGELPEVAASENRLVIRGKLEQELAAMSPDEQKEFLADYGIESSALDRVIRASYEALGLISFFTVGEDEVRAWPIKRGTVALDSAEEIHSDIKKGFIRAEVVAYDDMISAGSHAEAKKLGKVRLEGKTYEVKDGDIINFRFNV